MQAMFGVRALVVLACLLMQPVPGWAQVDQQRAAAYFKEAQALCEKESAQLWAVSLCGPMVIADAATQTLATNEPPPAGPRPPMLGFVNAPIEWGGVQWSAYVWSLIPADDAQARGRLLVHEMHHRVQPVLGQMLTGEPNDHLDTKDGRYWLQLEWRALAAALGSSGEPRTSAIRDALTFRSTRRLLFPGTANNERIDELREGLAQYTGTVVAAPSTAAAVTDAIKQLADAERAPTFVRTFAYPSGTAYGLLLDVFDPGWNRRMDPDPDLGWTLRAAAEIDAPANAEIAASRYGGPALRLAEEKRHEEQQARVAELRRRFVDGPMLLVPRSRGAMINTTWVTPIPGEGTVFFEYRVTGEWGRLESKGGLLESADGLTLKLSAPFRTEGPMLSGDGWTVVLTSGWVARPGVRAGDFQIVRADR